MTLEEKYHHAIIVLQAISQHTGRDKYSFCEWTQARAFFDCREAATRCLLKLGEPTELQH